MIELTEPMQQALDGRPGQPLRVVDPRNNEAYVVVKAEQFDKLRSLIEIDESDIPSAYPLMDAVARKEGWDDPEWDSYNIYAPQGQS